VPRKPKSAAAAAITMRDIAERAGVSIGTVSHVINENAPVREKLRRRVLDAIEELGYQPSELARGLRRNKTSILGMIIPDITNPFFPAVVRGAEDVAYQNSYELMLCNTDNDPAKERAYLHELRSYRMAGLILIPSVNSQINPRTDLPRGTPVVCLDRRPARWEGDSVTVDNVSGATAATDYLLQMGHRHIAAITGSLQLTNAKARLEGFRTALARAHVEVDPEYIQEGRFDRLSGYEKTRTLLQLRPRPTALFASNDLIALGVLTALREAGMHCPDDISIVGFDDQEFAEFIQPALTTVAQPGYQMGAKGAGMLLKRVQGFDGPWQHAVLTTELKIRQSVAECKTPARRAKASN
jgi:DNA-binding LacI/PurR family transcriptional regulator